MHSTLTDAIAFLARVRRGRRNLGTTEVLFTQGVEFRQEVDTPPVMSTIARISTEQCSDF